jgi:hypothetical protein
LTSTPSASALGGADFSVFVYGATGRFKTALASLLQQHFGAGFAAHRLPGSWASTANFNEVLAFIAKDALLVIDDFRPGVAERRRLEGEADRLLRAAANGAGRGRLKSDTSLLPAHPPRALILSTGEEKPSGEILIARMFLVEVAPGDIDAFAHPPVPPCISQLRFQRLHHSRNSHGQDSGSCRAPLDCARKSPSSLGSSAVAALKKSFRASCFEKSRCDGSYSPPLSEWIAFSSFWTLGGVFFNA